jgi:selenocysteine lyase/cysteine desulfurase
VADEFQAYLRNLVVGVNEKVPLLGGEYVNFINFDNAATTPPLFSVMKEINEFVPWYSSVHRGAGYKSVLSSNLFEEGRDLIKAFVRADRTRDVLIYTKNTTESINVLAHLLAQSNRGEVVISTCMEHLANDLPWRENFIVEFAALDVAGRLSLEDLTQKLAKHKGSVKLVTVTGASNVTGYKNPIHKIARLAHKYGAQILVDGAQLVPHCPVDMKDFDSVEHIDYLVFSAHKMYAPFGTGILIGPKAMLEKGTPLLSGGGAIQLVSRKFIEWESAPYKHEAGTPNVIGVAALLASIKELQYVGMEAIHNHEKKLIRYALEGMSAIDGLQIYSSADKNEERISTVSFNLPGIHHEVMAKALSWEVGIAVRNGLFCAHPYVEQLLGLTEETLSYQLQHEELPFPGMVRISFGLYNHCGEIDVFLRFLQHLVRNKTVYKQKYEKLLKEPLQTGALPLYPLRGRLP